MLLWCLHLRTILHCLAFSFASLVFYISVCPLSKYSLDVSQNGLIYLRRHAARVSTTINLPKKWGAYMVKDYNTYYFSEAVPASQPPLCSPVGQDVLTANLPSHVGDLGVLFNVPKTSKILIRAS